MAASPRLELTFEEQQLFNTLLAASKQVFGCGKSQV